MRNAPRSSSKADPCCQTLQKNPLKPLTSVPPHSRGKEPSFSSAPRWWSAALPFME